LPVFQGVTADAEQKADDDSAAASPASVRCRSLILFAADDADEADDKFPFSSGWGVWFLVIWIVRARFLPSRMNAISIPIFLRVGAARRSRPRIANLEKAAGKSRRYS
jgi:hypothetical protein